MQLDKFDQDYLECEGNPQEILLDMLGWRVKSASNAKKYHFANRQYLTRKQKLDEPSFHLSNMEETITKADGTITTKRMLYLSEEDSKDPIRIMELMGFDPLQFQMVTCEARRNYWDVTIKNKAWEGEKHTNHAFAIKLTVKPIQNRLGTDQIKKILETIEMPPLHTYRGTKGANKLLELGLMDTHFGKRGMEGAPWGIVEAEKTFRWCVEEILERVKAYNLKIEQIVLPVGQDFFHVDNPQETTTKGTPQKVENEWHEIADRGLDLLIWTVENLRAVAPVKILYICSNHDEVFSYFAVLALHRIFKSDPNVTVDISDNPRKYVRYGKCLIGLGHGDEEGKRITDMMQIERADDWSETVYREYHLAHLHSEQAFEQGGVIYRRLSPLTPVGPWSIRKGFIGSQRKAQAWVWDKEKGKQVTIDVNVTC